MPPPKDFIYPFISAKAALIYENMTYEDEKALRKLSRWSRPAFKSVNFMILVGVLVMRPFSGHHPSIIDLSLNAFLALIFAAVCERFLRANVRKRFLCDTEFALRMGYTPETLSLFYFWPRLFHPRSATTGSKYAVADSHTPSP